MMRAIRAVFLKEWQQGFGGPSLWLQIALFASVGMALTFFAGHFFDAGRADLSIWFAWLPWVMVLFAPVIGARLWVQEFETGTIDLLATRKHSMLVLTVGKWLALWAWLVLALLFVLPLWAAISWLGSPDHGAIITGIFGSILMAGAFAGLVLAASSLAPNSASAALLGVLVGIAFSLPVLGSLLPSVPPALVETLAGFSIPARLSSFARGVLSVADMVYFLSLAGFGILSSALLITARLRQNQAKQLLKIPMLFMLFVLANLLLPQWLMPLRLDMTQGKIFSLSSQGRQIVKQMKAPQKWTFFYSSSLAAQYPDIRQFGAQVRQTLAFMAAASGGKLQVQERNPLPDSALEDAAIAAGMQPVLTDTAEPLYFGIADKNGAVIARFEPGRASLLEYDI
ncbi:hypothetical protein MNBD_ALPHA06-1728, partial [hydrothermal vent metagenome]